MKKCLLLFCLVVLAVSVSAEKRPLTFEDMFKAGRLSSLTVSPDGKWTAFTVTQPNLEGNSFQRDVYCVSLPDGRLINLSGAKGQNHSASFRTDGKLAFISDRDGTPQLYQVGVAASREQAVQPVLEKGIPGGIGSYIWGGGNRWLAFQKDVFADAGSLEESIKRDEEIEASGLKVKVLTSLMYRVWNAWRDGKRSHVFAHDFEKGTLVDLTTGEYDTPPLDLGGKQDFVFSPDGQWFAYVKNTDEMVAVSTNNDIYLKRLSTLEEENLTAGNDGNDMNPLFSPKGRFLAYLSMARPGFEADKRNIILYDLKTRKRRNLTSDFKYNVNEIMFSPGGDAIYYNVTESVYHPIYRINLKNGRWEKLMDEKFL